MSKRTGFSLENSGKIGQIKPEEIKSQINQKTAENKTTSLKNERPQEVQLFVEGQDLVDLDFFSVSDPICTLKTRDSRVEHASWNANGETEVIDNNLNPKWIQHFSVWFVFIKDIDLCFQVWNHNDAGPNDLIGQTEVSLSQLMTSNDQQMRLTLSLPEEKNGKKIRNRSQRGFLTVRADKIRKTDDIIKFQISANLKPKKFLCFNHDAPYLVIERARQNNTNSMVQVFKTATAHDETHPWWEPQTLPMTEFCNNNKQLPLRISVYNYHNSGEHKKYGSVETTTRGIEMMAGGTFQLTNSKGQNTGTLNFNQFQMDMRPSLLEYLGTGWKLNVSIAVDFTLSNLEIKDQRSLHRQMKNGEMNHYEKAIFEVCNVMQTYALNGCFNVYGFGGIPHYMGYKNQVSRLWNLNGKEDPRCQGTMEVLQAYQKGILGTTLAGPSYFTPLLSRVKNEITTSLKETGLEGNRIYHVVIIVTDGNCHDMDDTTRMLVSLSGMPFSGVVIGVGDGDFEQMEILDADGEVLTDKEDNQAIRDIVQLVQYSDFKDLGQRELALEVLGELPDQFVDYQVMKENERHKIYQPTEPKGIDTQPLESAGAAAQEEVFRLNPAAMSREESKAALEEELNRVNIPLTSNRQVEDIEESDPLQKPNESLVIDTRLEATGQKLIQN